MKLFRAFLLIVLVAQILLPMPVTRAESLQPEISAGSNAVIESGVRRSTHPQTGKLTFLGADPDQPLRVPQAMGRDLTPEARGTSILDIYGPEFGIRDAAHELTLLKLNKEEGRAILHYQQIYRDIPVLGGELILNIGEDGSLFSINGEVSPDLNINTQPQISAATAQQIALGFLAKVYSLEKSQFTVNQPSLWIYDERLLQNEAMQPPHLVWRMEVTSNAVPLRELILVNAQNGQISLHFNQVDTAWAAPRNLPGTGVSRKVKENLFPETSKTHEVPVQSANEVVATQISAPQPGSNLFVNGTSGNDANDCLYPASPCLTINGALAKPQAQDNTIYVTEGLYSPSAGAYGAAILFDKNVNLSGGWDNSFSTQNGYSTIMRTGPETYGIGIYQWPNVSNAIENIKITNFWRGISAQGNLVLRKSIISTTEVAILGINLSITIEDSALIKNRVRAIEVNNGTLNITNSTISNNNVNNVANRGGGIYSLSANIVITNSTISQNSANDGGGIYGIGGSISLKNTILANNHSNGSPDCSGSSPFISLGYNIIGEKSSCNISPAAGDQFNVDPQLGPLVEALGIQPLLANSPAIDQGNASFCPAVDQRQVSRPQGSRCDIGAYEYMPASSIALISMLSGDHQLAVPGKAFRLPLQVVTSDNDGDLVSGVTVTFTSPSSGPSATFDLTGTNIASVLSDARGTASVNITANDQAGAYVVTASVSGVGSVDFNLENRSWYVSASRGADTNDCLTPATPCATIDSAIQKASIYGTILVEAGTYTSANPQSSVISIRKDITILGGWDSTFTNQTSYSTIDSNNRTTGLIVYSGVTAIMERFMITNSGKYSTGGIINEGTLLLSQCEIRNNQSYFTGGGVRNRGYLSLDRCVVIKNYARSAGGGIDNDGGKINITNSLIKDNITGDPYDNSSLTDGGGILNRGVATIHNTLIVHNVGSGIRSDGELTITNSSVSENLGNISGGIFLDGGHATIKNTTIFGNRTPHGGGGVHIVNSTAELNNVTISNNIAYSGGGIYVYGAAHISIQNSILANNSITDGMGPNCFGTVTSNGYNIINNKSQCTITTEVGDQIVNPDLGAYLSAVGYQPILANSPAINAGDPATCLPTDQRGMTRSGTCDIGAYEYTTAGSPAIIKVSDGDDQHIVPGDWAQTPLQVNVLDSNGTPVSGVEVTFSAPANGATGTFENSENNTITVTTDATGVAQARFRANRERGTYRILAQSNVGIVEFKLSNLIWFVSPAGDAGNDCLSPSTPCSHLRDVLSKSTFYPDDTVWLASGTYALSDTDLIHITTSITVVGGWNNTFTDQNGSSIFKNGIYLISAPPRKTKANLSRLVIDSPTTNGITNSNSILLLENSTIKNNLGGVVAMLGNTTIINSTISGNSSGGIVSSSGGKNVIRLLNSSVINNSNDGAGGISVEPDPENKVTFILANSIVAGNHDRYGINPDCEGHFISQGHNIIGRVAEDLCRTNWSATDWIGTKTNPIAVNKILDTTLREDPITGQWYHPLKLGSPAIDGGNTAPPGSDESACAPNDQLGVPRPQGTYCDIGAVEFRANVNPPEDLLATYSAGKTTSLPGTQVCSSNDGTCNSSNTHAKAAHANAYSTYQWYQTWHGRNSIDNNGMQIVSTVHYGNKYANAFWNGHMMIYGDAYGFPLADDVVAHELTHGVTQYESNLFYWYQSGAINESLSDLWGEAVDQANGLGNDSPAVKWLIGEDVTGLGAIRSMANPPAFGQPDSMLSPTYCKAGTCLNDNGGVHTNSGVNNKAAYLMVNGGTFNGFTIAPLGWNKVLTIYYEAQTHLLTSGADYLDLYNVLYQACLNKIGTADIQMADCQQVRYATKAVKMDQQPATNFNPRVAASCPAGTTKHLDLYVENFENGSDGWEFTSISGQSSWGLATGYARSGTTMLWGDGSYRYLNSVAMMTNGISLPANEKAYLHFSHAFLFEYYATPTNKYYFDGGVLEYSTDGKTWKDAKPLFNGGQNYKGVISLFYGNPLKGRSAFVGDSHGYVQSRYNLSSLAGKTIRFRWRIGTDISFPSFGWFVDDVRIYTCVPIPTVPSLLSPADNALTRDYTPTLDWSDSTPAAVLSHYELQLATNSTFTAGLITINSIPSSTYTPATDLQPNQKYYWRVRAYNISGGKSAWSAVRSFRTALLPPNSLAPGNPIPGSADNIHNIRPTFTWDAVPGAAGYVIEVATTQNFATKVISATTSATSFTPDQNLAASTVFYWRVRATGANGPSANSLIRTFLSGNPPSVPIPVSPANNALLLTLRPTFDWQNSTLPDGTTFKYYEFQIDTTNTFAAPTVIYTTLGDIAESAYTPASDLSPATTYYWRIRAWNDADDFSDWSATRSVRLAFPAPNLIEPVDGSTSSSLTPTFGWDPVTGASSYKIQISTVSNFSTTLINANVSATTYIPTANLPAGQTLYWRVRALGPYGPGQWSAVWSFTTP
jgi:Zn-dependent metalloprotease